MGEREWGVGLGLQRQYTKCSRSSGRESFTLKAELSREARNCPICKLRPPTPQHYSRSDMPNFPTKRNILPPPSSSWKTLLSTTTKQHQRRSSVKREKRRNRRRSPFPTIIVIWEISLLSLHFQPFRCPAVINIPTVWTWWYWSIRVTFIWRVSLYLPSFHVN